MDKKSRIIFTPNYDKLFNIVVYILLSLKQATPLRICKIVFFADKEHLNKYGRPVSGDAYRKVKNGPIPSVICDLIKQNDYLSSGHLQMAKQLFITLNNGCISLADNAVFDDNWFSDSDIEELNRAIDFCRDKKDKELSDITHRDIAWVKPNMNDWIDVEDLIGVDNPHRDDLIKILGTMSVYMDF